MSGLQKQCLGWWFICLVCLILGGGCSPTAMPSDASSPPESCFVPELGHPTIRKMSFLGSLPQQIQTLRFRIDWEDNQADLKGGSYQFFVDGEERTLLLFPEPLIGSGNAGAFELLLPLPVSMVVPGRRIRVELVLRDKRGTLSNRPSMILEFRP